MNGSQISMLLDLGFLSEATKAVFRWKTTMDFTIATAVMK
jgi:hypothetical protein